MTPILFSSIFSQFEQLEKKKKLFISPKLRKTCLGPIKSLLSFSTAQTEKNSWEKLGKTRLVVWWFYAKNKIKIWLQFTVNNEQLFLLL